MSQFFTRHALGTLRSSTPPRCLMASSLPKCRLLAARHHLHIIFSAPCDSSPNPSHSLAHRLFLVVSIVTRLFSSQPPVSPRPNPSHSRARRRCSPRSLWPSVQAWCSSRACPLPSMWLAPAVLSVPLFVMVLYVK
jgi:hypothetical protein